MQLSKQEVLKISKFISLVLRHKPQEIGLQLDEQGWVCVEGLLEGLKSKGFKSDMSVLENIVDTDDKGRYSFNENKTKIRANQGHSIQVDLSLEEVIPPSELYHGTSVMSYYGNSKRRGIQDDGIKRMKRNYVHLSSSIDTAIKVGTRHGQCIVLVIDTERMYKDGKKFYVSKNNVWLTEYVDTKYIKRGSMQDEDYQSI